MNIPWILVMILVFLLIVGILAVYLYLYSKKKIPKRKPDYYMFFILGIVWTGAGVPLGVTTENYGFLIMGLVFMILGLAHKKEWKKNHRSWNNLTPIERKFKMWVFVILGILVLLGLISFLILGNL